MSDIGECSTITPSSGSFETMQVLSFVGAFLPTWGSAVTLLQRWPLPTGPPSAAVVISKYGRRDAHATAIVLSYGPLVNGERMLNSYVLLNAAGGGLRLFQKSSFEKVDLVLSTLTFVKIAGMARSPSLSGIASGKPVEVHTGASSWQKAVVLCTTIGIDCRRRYTVQFDDGSIEEDVNDPHIRAIEQTNTPVPLADASTQTTNDVSSFDASPSRATPSTAHNVENNHDHQFDTHAGRHAFYSRTTSSDVRAARSRSLEAEAAARGLDLLRDEDGHLMDASEQLVAERLQLIENTMPSVLHKVSSVKFLLDSNCTSGTKVALQAYMALTAAPHCEFVDGRMRLVVHMQADLGSLSVLARRLQVHTSQGNGVAPLSLPCCHISPHKQKAQHSSPSSSHPSRGLSFSHQVLSCGALDVVEGKARLRPLGMMHYYQTTSALVLPIYVGCKVFTGPSDCDHQVPTCLARPLPHVLFLPYCCHIVAPPLSVHTRSPSSSPLYLELCHCPSTSTTRRQRRATWNLRRGGTCS